MTHALPQTVVAPSRPAREHGLDRRSAIPAAGFAALAVAFGLVAEWLVESGRAALFDRATPSDPTVATTQLVVAGIAGTLCFLCLWHGGKAVLRLLRI